MLVILSIYFDAASISYKLIYNFLFIKSILLIPGKKFIYFPFLFICLTNFNNVRIAYTFKVSKNLNNLDLLFSYLGEGGTEGESGGII